VVLRRSHAIACCWGPMSRDRRKSFSASAEASAPELSCFGDLEGRVELVDYLSMLGFWGTDHQDCEWRRLAMSRPSLEEGIRWIQTAMPILLEWPALLGPWLDANRSSRTGLVCHSLSQDLGRILKRARSTFGNRQSSQFIIEAIRRQLCCSGHQSFPVHRSSFFFSSAPSSVLSAASASRELSVTRDNIERFVRAGLVTGTILQWPRYTVCSVSNKSWQEFKSRLKNSITLKEAAARIGVSRRGLQTLMDVKLMPQPIRFRRRSLFPPSALTDVVCRLESYCTGSCDQADRTIIPLGRLSRLRRGLFGPVVMRILDRTIELIRLPDNTPSNLLDRYGVRRSDVLGRSLPMEGEELVGVHAAAQQLGVNTRMVPLLVGAGCLSITKGKGGRRIPKCAILADSVEQFRRQYRMTREIAARKGTSPRRVISLANERQLKPVIEADASKGISAVWRAQDADKLSES
jgi:hypothetical protein